MIAHNDDCHKFLHWPIKLGLIYNIYLHANHSINEEYETDEDGDPRKRLKGLDKGPQKCSDAFALAQQLNEPHDAKEAEEVDGDGGRVPRLQWEEQIEMNACAQPTNHI